MVDREMDKKNGRDASSDFKNAEILEAGFSLVEIMVVVFIMGLLATVVAVSVVGNIDKASTKKAQIDIAAFEQAIEMYRLDIGTYPTTEQGLEALVSAPAEIARPERYASDGYLKRLEMDPWGNPYVYVYPGEYGAFDVFSYGADGQEGGEDQNSDIGNWSE